MSTPTIPTKGTLWVFTYPNYGTPDGYPQYTAHSGQVVTVLRQLSESESDHEMYEIEASDGWKGHAHRDELSRIPAQRRRARETRMILEAALPNLPACDCGGEPVRDVRHGVETRAPKRPRCIRCNVEKQINRLIE